MWPTLTSRLARAPGWVLATFALTGAFGAYFCMYAFRKPFAVGSFPEAVTLPGGLSIDEKTFLVIAQVLGYCISKFAGIKFVSELSPTRRAAAIAGCMGVAELALVALVWVPAPWTGLCLFLNGLPLGVIWGLVFGFLEGRRVSDVLGVGLCVSFIVASGFVKSAGKWVLGSGVSEHAMPAVTGLLFAAPMALFVGMLAVLPPPSAADEAARTRRAPMDATARAAFFRAHAASLVPLVAAYVLLTALRDFRDNYARELWDALGYGETPSILTTAELPVALGSLVAVGLAMLFTDNHRALRFIHLLMGGGALLIVASTAAWQLGALSPVVWMISVGLGLYVGYVPFNCVLFDRMIAASGSVATAGFLIYVSDAFGYLGSVGLLLYRNFGEAELSWLSFYTGFAWLTGLSCVVLFAASLVGLTRPAPAAELQLADG